MIAKMEKKYPAGANAFGAPAAAPAANMFGAPAANAFGAPATPAPNAFGSPAPNAFGAAPPAAANAFGAPAGFGPALTPAATSNAFGAPPAAAAANVFGAPAASTFGVPATPATIAFAPALAAGAAPVDFRARLIEIWTAHAPAKLTNVDKVLLKYKGQEAKMIAKLEKKYKIAPPAVKPAAGAFGAAAAVTTRVNFGAATASTAASTAAPGAAPGAAPLFAMTGVVAETAVVVTEEKKKTTGAAAAASENDENNGGAGAAGTNENGGGSGRPRSQGVLSENDAAPAASVAGLGGGFPSLKVFDGGGAASKTAAESKKEKDDAGGDGDDDDAADAAAPLPIATAVDAAPLLVATAISALSSSAESTSASKEAAGPHPDDVRNAAYASGKKSSFMDSVRNGAAGAAPLPPPPPPPPALPRQLGPGPVQKDLVNSAVVEVQEWSRELIKWARELDDDARALAAAEANIDAQNAEITALDRRFAKEAVEARLLGAEGREWVLAFLRVCLLSADVSISLAAHTLLSTLSLLLLPSLPPPSLLPPFHTHTHTHPQIPRRLHARLRPTAAH